MQCTFAFHLQRMLLVKWHHLLLLGFLHFQPVYFFLPTDHHFIERDLLLGSHKRKCWKRLIRNAMEHWVIRNEVEMEKLKHFSLLFWRDLIPMPKKNTSNSIICPFITSARYAQLKKMKRWKITFKNADVSLNYENIWRCFKSLESRLPLKAFKIHSLGYSD